MCIYMQNLATWYISSIHIPAGVHLSKKKGASREERVVHMSYSKISSKLQCLPRTSHSGKQPHVKWQENTCLLCRAVLVAQHSPNRHINAVMPSSQSSIITSYKIIILELFFQHSLVMCRNAPRNKKFCQNHPNQSIELFLQPTSNIVKFPSF